MAIIPIILSGGVGGRLWPVSRVSYPKQFIPLLSEYSLLQETLMRLNGLPELNPPILVCNAQHRFIAAEQLRTIESHPQRIYLEPISKNTAPAATIAIQDALANDSEAIVLILPSDHVILQTANFYKAIHEGESLAKAGYLVTMGIVPTEPKTGYGYVRQGEGLQNSLGGKAFIVEAFIEKPDRIQAKLYVESGQYFWNSGIFMFKASVYLNELKRYAPEIYRSSALAYETAHHEADFSWLDQQALETCPSQSLDYALMEKTKKAVVIPVDMGWSDVGSWGALWQVLPKDAQGNATEGPVFMKDVSNCYIKSKKDIVAALGVHNLIIIETEDALLIAHTDHEQEVKDVFKKDLFKKLL